MPACSTDLQEKLENVTISLARRPKIFHDGADVQPLPPRLWEKLRLELQAEFRRATGEPQAVLHFEIPGIQGVE